MDRSIYRCKFLERLIAAHSLNFKRKPNMTYIANRITPLSQSRVTTKGFDISTLATFQPAKAHCQKCLALLRAIPYNQERQIQCPICGVHYNVI